MKFAGFDHQWYLPMVHKSVELTKPVAGWYVLNISQYFFHASVVLSYVYTYIYIYVSSLKLTANLHLKMDCWNTSFREGVHPNLLGPSCLKPLPKLQSPYNPQDWYIYLQIYLLKKINQLWVMYGHIYLVHLPYQKHQPCHVDGK